MNERESHTGLRARIPADSTRLTLGNRIVVPPALCVSVHDVAPATWAQCDTLLQAIRAVADIPVTLLVVPAYHRLPVADSAKYDCVLEKRLIYGDELVLHGYTHLDEAVAPHGFYNKFIRQIYTRGEGEFYAIDRVEARQRLEKGLAWFEQRRWPVQGFVAPAWLLGVHAWQALGDFPFIYTTTLPRFYLMPQRTGLFSPSLVYTVRTAWRRKMACVGNAMLLHSLRQAPLVRLGLHPTDAAHPQIVRHFQKMLEVLLTYRVAMTKTTFAQKWRHAEWLERL